MKTICIIPDLISPVYVVLADIDTVMDFARVMYDEKLTDTGEYVIIAVDNDEAQDTERLNQYCSSEGSHPYTGLPGDERVCRNLLILTPVAPINYYNKDFKREVLERTREPPFSAPKNTVVESDMTLPIYAALAYDAVQVLAKALTEAYKKDENATGDKVIKEMINMTYTSECHVLKKSLQSNTKQTSPYRYARINTGYR